MNCIRIWACNADAEAPDLPRITGYEIKSEGLVPVTHEDIPAELCLTLTGICSCMTVSVEPKPDSAAMTALQKFALRAAGILEGAYETVNDPSGSSGYVFCAQTNDLTVRTYDRKYLSLWFAPANGTAENRKLLYEAIEKILPFALPSKYGDENPPDTEFSEDGREKFLSFLEKSEKPVWFCRRPLCQLILRDRPGDVQGRCGYISLELPAFLDSIPEWHEAFRRLLVRLSEIYSAFFAQLTAGECGVVSWWWRGIPYELGSICVIGKEYCELIDDKSMGTSLPDGSVLFEEPDGPTIDKKLLSKKKKGFLGIGSGKTGREAYTTAATIPGSCFGKR